MRSPRRLPSRATRRAERRGRPDGPRAPGPRTPGAGGFAPWREGSPANRDTRFPPAPAAGPSLRRRRAARPSREARHGQASEQERQRPGTPTADHPFLIPPSLRGPPAILGPRGSGRSQGVSSPTPSFAAFSRKRPRPSRRRCRDPRGYFVSRVSAWPSRSRCVGLGGAHDEARFPAARLELLRHSVARRRFQRPPAGSRGGSPSPSAPSSARRPPLRGGVSFAFRRSTGSRSVSFFRRSLSSTAATSSRVRRIRIAASAAFSCSSPARSIASHRFAQSAARVLRPRVGKDGHLRARGRVLEGQRHGVFARGDLGTRGRPLRERAGVGRTREAAPRVAREVPRHATHALPRRGVEDPHELPGRVRHADRHARPGRVRTFLAVAARPPRPRRAPPAAPPRPLAEVPAHSART